MIVVDASAVVELIAYRPPADLVARVAAESVLHAPHLLDTEVLSALRLGVLRGLLTDRQADEARQQFAALMIDRYPHRPLNDDAWSMRHAVSTYDATYVALARALGATLVTTDARLAAAPDLQVEVEAYHSSA